MFHENTGDYTFPTGRECICVFRTNRTLMRPREKGRLLWPANDKGRSVDPPLVFKGVFLGKRAEENSKRETWSEPGFFSDERRDHERRGVGELETTV
ncbi:hypothetical protein TNCV_4169181 [Trichonephila clavipes]|nr:hypothetical protein TNCV_4169181 [Trichonephila clavipes]